MDYGRKLKQLVRRLNPRTSSAPGLQYTPLTAPDHIRLLRIVAAASDQITVSLEEVGLGDDVSYECLSYTWDGPKYSDEGEYWTKNRRRVVCNNAVAYIRQNLYDALVQLKNLDLPGPLWIDALCINQDDIAERNNQVSQMGTIFKGATRVIVWLGEEDKNTKPAIENLRRSTLMVGDYYKDRSLGVREYWRCKYTDDELRVIINFTAQRRWYTRLWTVQETILARDIIFFCGSHSVPLEKLWNAILFVRYASVSSRAFIASLNLPDPQYAINFYQVGLSRHKRFHLRLRPFQDPSLDSLGYNIHAFRNSRSSDPRDKVFGLLGISDCNLDSVPRLVADYNMTTKQVYTMAARFSLSQYSKLSTLATVGDRSFNQVKGLPSWVPDLSVREWPSCFGMTNQSFSTATQEPYSIDWGDSDEETLVLQGCLWDRISFSSESQVEIKNGCGVSRLLQVFNASGSSYIHTNEPLGKAMQRLFIADKLVETTIHQIEVMGSEYDMEGAFERLFFRLVCFALHKAGRMEMLDKFWEDPEVVLRPLNKGPQTSSPSEGLASILHRGMVTSSSPATNFMFGTEYTNTSMLDALGCTEDPFASSWYHRLRSRRYFRTERGYLGLGLHHIKHGDGVYLIKGASVPYVFRRVSEDPADGFKLVGEAYVHGIMYGEILTAGPVKFERMEIH